jgi:hypothetical protein
LALRSAHFRRSLVRLPGLTARPFARATVCHLEILINLIVFQILQASRAEFKMKLPRRRQFLHLAAGAAALPVVSRITWAQAYPSRPVTIIVPFAGRRSVFRL